MRIIHKEGKKLNKAISGITAIGLICSVIFSNIAFTYCSADIVEDSLSNTVSEYSSYRIYSQQWEKEPTGKDSIIFNADTFETCEKNIEILPEFEGETNVIKLNEEIGYVTYRFSVQKAGKYRIGTYYYPVATGGTFEPNISFLIDNEIPFEEAQTVYLPKIFVSETDEIKQDKQGNDLRPRQIESPKWMEKDFIDNIGFNTDAFEIYLSQGEHTFTVAVTQEEIAFKSFKIYNVEKLKTYDEIKEEYKTMGYKEAEGEAVVIQGEDAFQKSHSDQYPEANIYSPNAAITPSDPAVTKLNIICGSKSQSSISWKVGVEESGLYKICARVLQNDDDKRGLFATRKLYINGEVPFKEASNIEFPYKSDWYNYIFGGEEPYLFYFEADKEYTLTLECVSGRLSEPLSVIETAITELNDICRQITMVTGVNPDLYRDYDFAKEIPDLFDRIDAVTNQLETAVSMFEETVGDLGSSMAEVEDILRQLKKFRKNPRTIPEQLSNFRVSVSSLSTWTYDMTKQWIAIDEITLLPRDIKMPRAKANIFSQSWFDIRAVLISFITDYNSISGAEGNRNITVWVATGRDQGNIIRNIVDDEFTPKTDISVKLSVTNPDNMTLLQATLAGKGPDVAMFVDKSQPVNLAARNLLVDLSQFDNFNEVTKAFYPSAIKPYEFNGGVYGLPNSQSFSLMFIRTDIFDELNISIPTTWDEFYKAVPFIQRNNMMIGMGGDNEGSNLYLFETLLMQKNSSFYNNELTKTALDTVEALDAFKMLTSFYTEYSMTLSYDFFTYFRSGIMPMAIADYTMYNMLSMAAPEIKGLWTVAPVPGIKMTDGTINNCVSTGGNCAVIFRSAADKNAAYDFITWWMQDDIQSRYSFDLESIMGPGARYNSANISAVNSLSWPKSAKTVINEQWKNAESFESLPSSYYISRNINNAFRAVVHDSENEREILNKYSLIIDNEITRKNKELGLDSKGA